MQHTQNPTRQRTPQGASRAIPATRALADALFRNTPLSRSFTLNREGI